MNGRDGWSPTRVKDPERLVNFRALLKEYDRRRDRWTSRVPLRTSYIARQFVGRVVRIWPRNPAIDFCFCLRSSARLQLESFRGDHPRLRSICKRKNPQIDFSHLMSLDALLMVDIPNIYQGIFRHHDFMAEGALAAFDGCPSSSMSCSMWKVWVISFADSVPQPPLCIGSTLRSPPTIVAIVVFPEKPELTCGQFKPKIVRTTIRAWV